MRRLGIDPGAARVGLALCDEEGMLAYPHKNLAGAAPQALAALLRAEVEEHGIGEIVMGLPVLMNGREGPAARKARALAKVVEEAAGVPVVLWDERLTTVSATRQLRASGVKGRKQREVVDQAAATVLLQSYLDAQRSPTGEHGPHD